MTDRRRFFDWNRPALDCAVDYLTEGWSDGPLDLRDRLIVVPTRQSGRRLRERLAAAAATRGTGVLMGLVETPAFLFRPPHGPSPLTSDVAAEVFWMRTLERASREILDPLGPSARSAEPVARMAVAAHVAALRSLLCEERHTIASLAEAFDRVGNEEAERWTALRELEKLYAETVHAAGWRDDSEAKRSAAERPVVPPGIRRVAVLFTPDPPPLALFALDQWAKSLPVDICVHAPADLANTFDEWGRPDPVAWSKRALSLDPTQVEICEDVASVAERVRVIAAERPVGERAGLVVGVADAQTAARIAMALARDGIGTFDPAGTPAGQRSLFKLVDRLLRLARDGRIESLRELLRHPHALRRLKKGMAPEADLLALFDELEQRHLPVSHAAARDAVSRFEPADPAPSRGRKKQALAAALECVEGWLRCLNEGPWSKSIPGVLENIFEGFAADEPLSEEARVLSDALSSLAELEPHCANRDEAAEVLRKFLRSKTINARRREQDLELAGWLELAWDDAPAVLLTDLNDGRVPETIIGDPFLPDGARGRLGLRDNRRRYARDAYVLETLVRSRPPDHLRGFTMRLSDRGDRLQPSRLLFQCDPGQLALRASHFFSGRSPAFPSHERKPGWVLRGPDPASAASTDRLSVSKLKTYLLCPFDYYLQNLLRLGDPIEPAGELDARAFGILTHEVFEAFARSDEKDSSDEGRIEKVLHAELDRVFALRFGRAPGLPLRIQRDLLRQRLTYAAREQARWRKMGWRIDPERLEHKLSIPITDTCTVTGRVDRVDVNENTGATCVMDYKTVAIAKQPEQVHLKKMNVTPAELEYAVVSGESRIWQDLQLPLYVASCRGETSKNPVVAAYFCLPNAVSDTRILEWNGLNDELVNSALDCARGIFERVRAGVFWPPRISFTDRDPRYRIFFDDIVKRLDPALLKQLESAAAAFDPARRESRGRDRS
ncbi:MAG: PD-(D/E)XK nuclease family protein [Kiritimatiellae bacterium]|nr:PD-(D/E)XK nuclease family protein [Kiritimatiellia bacterium]